MNYELCILLVILQTAFRYSQWRRWWPWAAALGVGLCVVAGVGTASGLSKPQVSAWLATLSVQQDVAVLCLLDALLLRWRRYPGLLVLPAAFWVLTQLLFAATGADFVLLGLAVGTAFAVGLPLLAALLRWLLPQRDDRAAAHLVLTVAICLLTLLLASRTPVSYHLITHDSQNITTLLMDYISKALFGIANLLLIPDILLLIVFFVRSLVLLVTTYGQYAARRKAGVSTLYLKYRTLLYECEPDEAFADYLATQFEAEAAKDVNLSRLLTKLGPVLGLIGTLISMSPALVGLSTGDISGMAYNMQVVFSATVVGLVISVVGLFTQQLKSRWYQKDLGHLDYVSRRYTEHHEQEA